MDIDLAIQQLRVNLQPVGGRVAGAAGFAKSTQDQAWMELPAAYVLPGDEDADENPPGNGLDQHVIERIKVIVEFDNSLDRRGQAASEQYSPMRAAVWACLLNWRIDPQNAAQGLYYEGGRMLDFDRARLFYEWTFALRRQLSDLDGWQEPSDPLMEVDFARSVKPVAQILLPQT